VNDSTLFYPPWNLELWQLFWVCVILSRSWGLDWQWWRCRCCACWNVFMNDSALFSFPWNSESSWYFAAGTGIKVAIKPIYRIASPIGLFTSCWCHFICNCGICYQCQCFLHTDSSSWVCYTSLVQSVIKGNHGTSMVDHSKVLLVCTWQAQLLVQNREVPRSLFQFDCDLERRILAEAELQGHHHVRASPPPQSSQSNGGPSPNLTEVRSNLLVLFLISFLEFSIWALSLLQSPSSVLCYTFLIVQDEDHFYIWNNFSFLMCFS